MAIAANTVTTSGAGGDSVVTKVWKRISGDLAQGLQFKNMEWEMTDDFLPEDEETAWSAREVEIPIDINEGAGIASIPEFGTEARESSPNVETATISLVHFNGRFNASNLSHWGDTAEAQVERQLRYQGAKKIQDLSRHFSDYFYGVSNGYLAQISDASTGTTLTHTLIGGYGVSGITNTTFLASKFKQGDYVALVRSGSLVTNAIGKVGAVTEAGAKLTVTWNGSVTSVSADYVVKANSKENTTIAGTDYSRGLVGMIDILTTASVHSLSSSTVANWSAAFSDTAGSRLSGVRLTRAYDEIEDQGGGKANVVLMDKAVRRDFIALERAALRQMDPLSMEVDGDIKSKGRKFLASKRVPPGYCFVYDSSGLAKWALLPKPTNRFSWGDGKEYTDLAGRVFSINLPVQMVTKNRKKFAYFSGLTTQ